MSNPEQESSEVNQTNDENHNTIENEKSSKTEEQESVRRMKIPQDIRYATEQDDREKLSVKYDQYQISDSNTCNIRFVIDHRQKKNLLGRYEEEDSNLHSISKTFNLNLLTAYQSPPKHSFKIFGTETNVRKCLIEILNRIFKQHTRSPTKHENGNHHHQTSDETEGSHDNEKSSPHPTSVFVTTINRDSSVTEEKKPIESSTSNSNEDKKEENNEHDQYKFIPLERKPEYTFTILITSQGQEVLKKNWSFFGGSLQQRLNVTVMNPFKLPKFGDNQWQNELSITGELFENIIDAALQLTAFINDVLGIPNQPYKSDEEYSKNDSNSHQRSKTDYQSQRRHEHNNNNNYRQPPSQQYQGQSSSSPFNNHHERTFVNRGRNNGVYEQIILIRSNCVARIVGTRGSNLRRIQTKCHLRDMIVARQPNENGYVDCTLTAYQTRNLNFAIDTIRSFLRNEDEQAIQVLEAHYVELPLQSSSYQNSPHYDQPQLSVPNQNFENFHQQSFTNNRSQQQQQLSMSFTGSSELQYTNREPGFMTRPLHFGNGTQLPQPSYNFRNTPSFDFTHQPTSAARKTDKRPGEVNDFNNTTSGQARTSTDCQTQHYGGSSSSNSSSVSPRHQSKRTCPETKEIDCTTDDGFWIQKQYYHALDDTSKELFDNLLDKLDKIRIANEENAARKQQRLVGRTRTNKSRAYMNSTAHTNDTDDLIKQDNKIEELPNNDEQKDEKEPTEISTKDNVEQN